MDRRGLKMVAAIHVWLSLAEACDGLTFVQPSLQDAGADLIMGSKISAEHGLAKVPEVLDLADDNSLVWW